MADALAILAMPTEFILTILILSFMWKENMGFRIAENAFIGLTAGYMAVLALDTIYKVGYLNVVAKTPRYGMIVAIVLGLMLYLRYSKKTEGYSRWPIALLIGVGTSLAMRGGVDSMFIKQIQASLVPLNTIDNIILVLGTICALYYFFFTLPRKGTVASTPAKIGRYVLIIGFGAQYAATIASRLSLLIDRLSFLISALGGG